MGLKSRINYHFDFKDYNVDELIKIFLYLAKERDYEVSSDAVKIKGQSTIPSGQRQIHPKYIGDVHCKKPPICIKVKTSRV